MDAQTLDRNDFNSQLNKLASWVLPRSSGPDRHLTIHVDAHQVDRETGEVSPDSLFTLGFLIVRATNYTQVYGYRVTGEDHIVVDPGGANSSWRKMTSFPVSEVEIHQPGGHVLKPVKGLFSRRPEHLGFTKATSYGGAPVVIPGDLLLYFNHDSCWRDFLRQGVTRLKDEHPIYKGLEFYNLTFRISLVTLEGARREPGIFGEELTTSFRYEPQSKDFGPCGVVRAMMVLAPLVGKPSTVNISLRYALYQQQEEPERGSEEAEGYNYRLGLMDVTPRTMSWWSPLQASVNVVFDSKGRVIEFNGVSIEPTVFDRDFLVSSNWKLPAFDTTSFLAVQDISLSGLLF